MAVALDGFTIGAEIRIMADGAFVTKPCDIRLMIFVAAEGTVTVDAEMLRAIRQGHWQGFVDRRESMAAVNDWGALEALRAVIEIRAIEALVTYAIDGLLKC